ncbi:hypothetical protein BDW60DRAFT_192183 [Aspergillus nidulans var. acristatus]
MTRLHHSCSPLGRKSLAFRLLTQRLPGSPYRSEIGEPCGPPGRIRADYHAV